MHRILIFLALAFLFPYHASAATFVFGASEGGGSYQQVTHADLYSAQRGFGFEPGAAVSCDHSCESNQPFYFSAAVAEGNYRVTINFGSDGSASNNTVKAELRRLMLENVSTEKGKFVKKSFIVNVRRPQIPNGGEVVLKDRERTMEWWAWDEKLTLEFDGSHPAVRSVEIMRVENIPTIFLLGDSTVCDQPREPYSSWGQMLPRFFNDKVAIANHAESGESLRSSLSAKRLEKVLSMLRRGDHVLIQFGHNDEKERGEGIGAFTSYSADLKKYVESIRQKGGTPVLITPVQRRTFDAAGKIANSHGDYPEAVRRVAAEAKVPLIDLHKMSTKFYESLGAERSKLAFKQGDGTHHNNYGAYQLAKMVVEGIRGNRLTIAKNVVKGWRKYNPSQPDSVANFTLFPSPLLTETKPPGN